MAGFEVITEAILLQSVVNRLFVVRECRFVVCNHRGYGTSNDIGFRNKLVSLTAAISRKVFHHADLEYSGSSIEQRAKRYKNTGPYKRLIMKSGILPPLKKGHVMCVLGMFGGLISALFLTLSVVFPEQLTGARFLMRVVVWLVALILSVIIFYAGVSSLVHWDSRPVVTVISRRVPYRLTRSSAPLGVSSCQS